MTAPAPQKVNSINWLNWLNVECAIEINNDLIYAGLLSCATYTKSIDQYFITIGQYPIRFAGSDMILIGTLSQASQFLYGQPLNPQ